MKDLIWGLLVLLILVVSVYCLINTESEEFNNTSPPPPPPIPSSRGKQPPPPPPPPRPQGPSKIKITFKSSWGTDLDLNVPASGEKPHTGNILMYAWHMTTDANVNNRLGLSSRNKTLVSAGLRKSAEFGMNDQLMKELGQYKNVSTTFITDKSIQTPIEKSWTFGIDANYPLLTFVTMIAPSADWFVAETINMSEWHSRIVMPLYCIDAGTDKGNTLVTLPKHPRSPFIPPSQLDQNSKLFRNKKVVPVAYLYVEFV